MKRNGLQIETAIEIDRSNDVSSNMPLSLKINKRRNRIYTHCKVGTATKSVFDIYYSVHGKRLTYSTNTGTRGRSRSGGCHRIAVG